MGRITQFLRVLFKRVDKIGLEKDLARVQM